MLRFFLFLWLGVTVCAAARVASPRLALFSNDADLEALLTSKLDGVVSRSGLPQIAAEKSLTSVPLALEGADLALVVESGPVGSVRLIEAKSGGTILDLLAPPMPAPEEAEWISRRVGPYLGNSVDAEAPRISLIGLRFETDSPEHRTDERLANLALANELQKCGAVVLERWRLGDLVFEKSLRHDESPFWKAADLLDGSLRQDTGGFSARLRIRNAAGTERTFHVEGSTIQDLALKISKSAIQRKLSDLPDEKPNSEAQSFLEEARWMLAHGLACESLQAVEAALALDAPGCEPEMLRVKASAMISYPDDLRSTHGQDGGYRADAFPAGELPERVAAATETMLLAGDYWTKHLTSKQPERWTLEHPATLGVHTLYTGLRVLRTAHDSGWFRDHAEPVRALREAIRRNIELMADGEIGRLRSTFFTYLTNYAGYWNETPADAIAFYRKVLATDFDAGHAEWAAVVRAELAYNNLPHLPFVAGNAPKSNFPFRAGSWRVVDWTGDSARSVWLAFLDELASAHDPLKQADSLALRWQTCGDNKERLDLTSRIVDFLDANKEVFSGPLGTPVFSEFLQPLRTVNDSKGLARAQDKLVRFFLYLLDAPGPLPKGVLPKVWAAFCQSKQNGCERQAQDLLVALDAREKRAAFPVQENSEIASARASIQREFPSLRAQAKMPGAVDVTRLWISGEHTPEPLKGQIGFHWEAAIWHEGHLWVLDPHFGRLWRIQPETGDAEIISPDKGLEAGFDSQLVSWDQRLAVAAHEGVWVLKSSVWQKMDLPTGHYHIGNASGKLWAASGEAQLAGKKKESAGTSLFSINSDFSTSLVASSRRRPPEHPMDRTIAGEPYALLPAKGGGVILGTHGDEGWRFLDSATGRPPARLNERYFGIVRGSSSPDLIVRCQHPSGDRNRLVRVELFASQGDSLLMADPERDSGRSPRFIYPRELGEIDASEYVAAWDGKHLWILAWSSRGSPWGASEAWILHVSDSGYSWAPLHFVWPENGDQRAKTALHEPRVFRYPYPDPKGLVPTDHGLVITGRGMQGFWYVPYADLNNKCVTVKN